MTKEEEKYLFWLTSLSGLGLPFVQRFFERYKSIDKARSLSETDIKKCKCICRMSCYKCCHHDTDQCYEQTVFHIDHKI